MPINVVTIAREHFSGGDEIARLVAADLGWSVIDRQLVDEVARRADVPPETAEALDGRVDSWIFRIGKSLWAGGPDAFAGAPGEEPFDADVMARHTAELVRKAAERGRCVILGRGGSCILADRDDALHVFVHAERAFRVARARAEYERADDAADAIAFSDRERATYIRHYYGCPWGRAGRYDLAIDGSRVPQAAAAAAIVAAVRAG